MKKNQLELLAPAGSYDIFRAVLNAGADAVYVGGGQFGARAYANNFSEEELLRAIDEAHIHGKQLYLTVNTLLKEEELEAQLYDYLRPYYEQGLDAVIVQDMGAFQFIREYFPKMDIHTSTQMTICNRYGAEMMKELGATRVVTAREMSFAEIKDIADHVDIEIESFVHGALCYCYSGQCLLSSMIGGRSGNRGQCAQPCRLPYSIADSKPKDLLSMKDLSVIRMLPELIEAGIDSFKIEGRMKQPEYVYTVTRLYRKYADLYLEKGKAGYHVSEKDRKELENAYRRRGYTDGYYKRHNGKEMISLCRPEAAKEEAARDRDYKIKEKINGKLILSNGKHAKLCMEYKGKKDIYSVVSEGEIVQTAQKAPLDIQRVEKQMKKTGNTAFVFDTLVIEMDENIFLPMQALNELRRNGLQTLEETVLGDYRRQQKVSRMRPESPGTSSEEKRMAPKDMPVTDVSVQTAEQLSAVIQIPGIHTIYVEGDIALDDNVVHILKENPAEKQIYFSMPYIFRQMTADYYEKIYERITGLYDGIMIRNWESYEWLQNKNYPKTIISDYNMYVFNRKSKEFIKQTAIKEYTVSPELNSRELSELGPGGILTVYGYQPVMITANCIWKTTSGCSKKKGTLYLSDRYKKKFAVKNYCRYCYNIMYNCIPLVLFDLTDEIRRLDFSRIRLDFTIEKADQVYTVIHLCKKAFGGEKEGQLLNSEYTRGHFKRGVK